MAAYTYAVLKISIESTVPMASAEFHEAIAYALSCVRRHDLTLTVKHKQEEYLEVIVVHL